jgi:hypothetical protein
MGTGPTKKLDFDKGRAKARVIKPDYRDRFVDEGDNFDRGGSHGNRIMLVDAARFRPAIVKIARDDKARAIKFYEGKIRGSMLKIDQWKFRFNMTPHQFAKENGISMQQSEAVLPDLKRSVEERLRITLGRAQKATLQASEVSDGRYGWQLCFKTFLQTVEPIEWFRIYKRVLLSPTE